ncbi:hypothetical protein IQ238_05835 [Pleurocapsales cyanobacterium LEGE 06147]|nr:hypothetical protein [Pleurocapsales cyanobacterium LEGE 06147]
MVLLKNGSVGDEKELSFSTAVSARLSTYHGTSLPSSRNSNQANKILSNVGTVRQYSLLGAIAIYNDTLRQFNFFSSFLLRQYGFYQLFCRYSFFCWSINLISSEETLSVFLI